ncbi:hypothetical protein VE01_07188 [Pseudogymnoascus verrucosus]|uniref:Uncharacterized protein n=1 Tax=Pseudogymnoascus verrucosus TaxID=342668 RepID=A0A1B8GF25_9PEZI|nr:uncharacterized protein VE01_07188 [Pseudogymnoascus verrucosus]OBT94442.1 hypothetical protein VE01_07188 [Pseudogymnoascus verrucosus]
MKFSYTLAAVFATAAVAAPVAQAPAVPVDAGLLAKLSPDVAALVTGLGLTTLAPGLAATLVTLSEGLKTRQVGVPVDAGLLAKLSPDVAALVTGLGLTTLAPGLAATLVTLSEGLKTRQVEGVVNTVETVVTPVTDVVSGLVAGVGARQDVPVVGDLVQQLEAILAGLTSGVAARQNVPVAGDLVQTLEALLASLKGGVAARQSVPAVGDLIPTVEALLASLTNGTGVIGARDIAGLEALIQSLTAGGAATDIASKAAGSVPVDAGLLAKLSPDVAALVTGLGLTSLAPGLASTLITLSAGLKTRQVPDVVGELQPALEAILAQVTGAVQDKVVPTVQGTVEKVVPTVQGTVEKVVPTVKGTVEQVTGAVQGLGARDVAGVPVDAGLLAKLSPDVAALVTGLGLTTLAPGLAATLITLSEGLKTRQVDSVVPDIPVDAGLLAKLSPDVAALVSGLGLTSIAPGLAATLVTLSEGLKTRQVEGVVNTVETVVTPVTGLVSGLAGSVGARQVEGVVNTVETVVTPVTGLAGSVGARQVEGVVNTVETVAAPVTGLVSGLAGGVVTRDVAGVPVDAGLLAKLSPDVAALVTGLGLTTLAPGLAATLITLSEGLKTRQSSDPLAVVTQALEAILNPVTSTVSGVVAPVIGAVDARDVVPAVGGVVSEVEGVVKNVTGNVGATDAASKVAGIPVDAGLLAQLSPSIAALVSGLGLTSLAPGLASTLITLSQGL